MRSTIVAVLVGYLLVLLGIGWWARRESGTTKGYFVAGKKLPSWVIAFSSNATGESAWLLLGLTGMGYAIGVHAFWIIMGEVLGVALAWVFVARPFKVYTDRFDSITVPDYLTDRFRDTKHMFRWIGLVIVVSMVAVYTAAQLTASGKAFESFLGLEYQTGVWIGAAVILYYTAVGGLKAVAYSDLLQGVLMFGALVTLPIIAIPAAGGWGALVSTLGAADPALLKPMGSFGLTLPGILSAAGFVGVGLAFLGAPQLLVRFMAARDEGELVDGGVIAVICMIGFDVGAVFSGMAGRALFPGLADPETVLPEMAASLFPAIFTGVFLVVVLAAIMSTADSVLLLASSSVVRDVVQKVFRPDLTAERVAFLGKIVTLVIGAVALVAALGEVRVIFWFVLFAWSGLASAFAPVVLCSLFWKGTTREGAIAGMIGGFAATVIWVVFLKAGFHDLYEMIPGFAVGFACTIGVSFLTQPPEGAAEEFDAVKTRVGPALRRR